VARLRFLDGFGIRHPGNKHNEYIAGSGFKLNFHAVTGASAIALMLFHAIWATYVLIINNEI